MMYSAIIRASLNDAAEKLGTESKEANREWTNEILDGIGGLGKKHKFWVYGMTSPNIADGGEFLFDQCWLHYDDDWLISVPLILECEWGGLEEITDDFQKLLIGRADFRVMIYCAANSEKCEEIAHILQTYVESFGLGESTDRYLLSCWDNQEGTFIHYSLFGSGDIKQYA